MLEVYPWSQWQQAVTPYLSANDDWPLRERKLISRTYQGDMDTIGGVDRVVQKITEHVQDHSLDPGIVYASARVWKNGFHEQWIPGQAMFSIESTDQSNDKHNVRADDGSEQDQDRRRRMTDAATSQQPQPLPDAPITTLVSLPQLMTLLHEASLDVNDAFDHQRDGAPPCDQTAPPQQQFPPTTTTTTPKPAATARRGRAGAVKVVGRAPVVQKTAREIVSVYSEDQWYADLGMWKTVVTGKHMAPYANIEYLRQNVRYVGILDREAEIQDDIVHVKLAATGNVQVHEFWGDSVAEGDCVGFSIGRFGQDTASMKPMIGIATPAPPYVVKPWIGKDGQDVPTREELTFVDTSGRPHIALFFSVGTVVRLNMVDRARTHPTRQTPVEKTFGTDVPYLGRYGLSVDPQRAWMFTQNSPRSVTVLLGASLRALYALHIYLTRTRRV
jgi:hypothetical protein